MKKILIATDGSESARQALEFGFDLGVEQGATAFLRRAGCGGRGGALMTRDHQTDELCAGDVISRREVNHQKS
jgi:Universal stress protein family